MPCASLLLIRFRSSQSHQLKRVSDSPVLRKYKIKQLDISRRRCFRGLTTGAHPPRAAQLLQPRRGKGYPASIEEVCSCTNTAGAEIILRPIQSDSCMAMISILPRSCCSAHVALPGGVQTVASGKCWANLPRKYLRRMEQGWRTVCDTGLLAPSMWETAGRVSARNSRCQQSQWRILEERKCSLQCGRQHALDVRS